MLPSPTEIRPWGAYQNLFEAASFLIKLIEISPGRRLSLQRHFRREEAWLVVSGWGLVELDGARRPIGPGDVVKVGPRVTHRVSNGGPEPLLILELQQGECREEDIERIEDDFGRAAISRS
jgi:mannose-6-phosphate isomerase